LLLSRIIKQLRQNNLDSFIDIFPAEPAISFIAKDGSSIFPPISTTMDWRRCIQQIIVLAGVVAYLFFQEEEKAIEAISQQQGAQLQRQPVQALKPNS
jgi:hypothetical protein